MIDHMIATEEQPVQQQEEAYDYWYWYFIRQQLLLRDECCMHCGQRLDKYTSTIDHLIPRSKGGTNEMSNLVLSCKDCNNEKGDMLPLDYIIWRLNQEDVKEEEVL